MKENKLKLRRNSSMKVAMKIFFTKPTYNIMQKLSKKMKSKSYFASVPSQENPPEKIKKASKLNEKALKRDFNGGCLNDFGVHEK